MKYSKSILSKFIVLWKAETGESLTFLEAEMKINEISLYIDPQKRLHNPLKKKPNEIDNLMEE